MVVAVQKSITASLVLKPSAQARYADMVSLRPAHARWRAACGAGKQTNLSVYEKMKKKPKFLVHRGHLSI